jgi:serine protease Do
MDGKVVGINSQIYSGTGGYMGLSFAIPMDVVMNVVDQIKTKGKVSRGWLGVQIQDVTRELAESFGMKRPVGALVAKIVAGSPAEDAALQLGDIITEFNGTPIEMSGDLPPIVGMTPIDQKANLTLIRQGEKKTIPIKVGLLPEKESEQPAKKKEAKPTNRLGISVTNLTDEQREQLQVIKNGVLVQMVARGPASQAGIQSGDVILRIDNNIVRDEADFDKIVSQLSAGKSIAVLIQRRGNPVFLAIKLDK